MSIDPSLRMASGLTRHRNVLTRAERIERLSKAGKFDMSAGRATGLVKVANRKTVAAKAAKKEAAAPGAEGAAAPAAAAGAKAPAAAAKPAAGAKAPAAAKPAAKGSK